MRYANIEAVRFPSPSRTAGYDACSRPLDVAGRDDWFHRVTLVAFAEGKVMIKGQQKVVGAGPQHRAIRTRAIALHSTPTSRSSRNECRVEMGHQGTAVSSHRVAGAAV
jgi:hypothetical protein